MSTTTNFDIHWIIDPGHGWLAVPTDILLALDIVPSEFSPRRAGVTFLEEDCDAGLYLDAVGASADGFPVQHVDDFERSVWRGR